MAIKSDLLTNAAAQKEARPAPSISVRDKLSFTWDCLSQKLSSNEVLFAGPYTGEFGYELMQWQGYVRAQKKAYREVHVLTYPGRDYLYEGCQVHRHDFDLKTAGYGYGHITPAESRSLARQKAQELGLKKFDIFDPFLLWTRYHKLLFWRQDFRLFQEAPMDGGVRDIAFHFRAVQKVGPDHAKNYSPELASELVSRCRDQGLKVVCIGHPDYSICPEGAEDFRSVDLRQTVKAVNSARAVAGENSGPMHLANLCGKPTILWAQDQWRLDYSLRWNPFQVPIYTAANDTCQPSPALVAQSIATSLEDLRLRTDNYAQPAYKLPPGRISPV